MLPNRKENQVENVLQTIMMTSCEWILGSLKFIRRYCSTDNENHVRKLLPCQQFALTLKQKSKQKIRNIHFLVLNKSQLMPDAIRIACFHSHAKAYTFNADCASCRCGNSIAWRIDSIRAFAKKAHRHRVQLQLWICLDTCECVCACVEERSLLWFRWNSKNSK